MRLPGFVNGSYESLSRMVAGEQCINLFPVTIETEFAKAKSALYSAPGCADFATTMDSPGRGIFAEETGRLFAVLGTTLYEVDAAGVPTALGQVAIDDNPATFATNGNDELLVTSGKTGYRFQLTGGALTVVVNDVTMCGSIDTFLVALDGVTGTLKISEESDAATWDPSQIAQRSAAPDRWVAGLVARREIYLFGKRTGEVWYNAGRSPFPFAQRPGAFFEVGIEAPFSLSPFGDTLAFLGRSGRGSGKVYWMNGYTPNVISNDAVELAIQRYKDAGFSIENAIGWSYERLGHPFYILEFPDPGKSWVFDGKENKWHERGRWNSSDNRFVPYRPRFQAEAFGKNLVCDSGAGRIYSFSDTVYTDVGGSALRRVRRVPHLSDENRALFLDYVEVDAERGVGLSGTAATQGSDPQLLFRASWDGGQTFGAERARSLGKLAEYTQRIRWDRCGRGRDLVMEWSCSEPVKVALFDAFVGIS